MIDQLYAMQPIRQIQIFYYASQNNIFINTFVIQILNQSHLPSNIKLKKTQISQPNHHQFGQAPFINVNNIHIIKKQQIIDFMILALPIDINRKYQFLSVATLSQQLANVSNLFSQFDQNPYFVFLSPWKKYKRHAQLQNKKLWYRSNTHFFNTHDDSLNSQYLIYKLNNLNELIKKYSQEYYTKPQYLKYYKVIIYSLLKHLKIVSPPFYQTAKASEGLFEIQVEMKKWISQRSKVAQERPPAKNLTFANIVLNYLKGDKIVQEDKKKDQEELHYNSQKQKLYQNIFRPVFATTLFVIAMLAFKAQKKQALSFH